MSSTAPPLRALLVGIDHYPATEGSALRIPDLRGAVNDVGRVRRVLLASGSSEDRVKCSISPRPSAPVPAGLAGAPEPTYAGLVAELEALVEQARAGENVLFYFAGQGSRIPTLLPDEKAADPWDECLVPMDLADPEARYLRDIELAAWARRIVKRGAHPILVIDACHGGGAHRHGQEMEPGLSRARFLAIPDPHERPRGSLLADARELAGALTASEPSTAPRYRDLALGSGWPAPHGTVLYAACQSHQRAFEHRFEDGWHGVFTQAWTRSLERLDRRATHQQVHDLARAGMLDSGADPDEHQRPVLEGEGRRRLLAAGRGRAQGGARVLRADGEGALLEVGRAHGIGPGARFLVPGAGPVSEEGEEADGCRLEVTDILDHERSRCRWVGGAAPEAGLRAVLVDPGPERRRRVAILADAVPRGLVEAMERSGFLEQAEGEVAGADYRIVLDDEPRIEVVGRAGPDRRLPLESSLEGSELAERLEHLALFDQLVNLRLPEPGGPLDGALGLVVALLGSDWKPGHPLADVRSEILDEPIRVRDGAWIRATLENRSHRALHLVLLDLRPDWQILQLWPRPDQASCDRLAPGARLHLPIRAFRVDPWRATPDRLLTVISTDPLDLRWRQLPPLGAAAASKRSAEPRPSAGWALWHATWKEIHIGP